MAIVKFGTLVVGVRGTIGGMTFSANHAGPHARVWQKPSNPATTYQQITRGRMTAYGALWNGMTAALRADWRTFAATPPEADYNSLGELILPTGWEWFCRIQQRLQTAARAVSTTVPGASAVTPPASATLAFAELPGGACTVTYPNATFGATDAAILYLAFNTTSGMLVKNSQRILTYAKYNPGNGPKTITTEVSARWGNIRKGWMAFGHLYKQRADGVRSTSATTSFTVT